MWLRCCWITCESREFCAKNEELCIKITQNEELCIKNEDFCFTNDELCRLLRRNTAVVAISIEIDESLYSK